MDRVSDHEPEHVCKRAVFSGRVQGVGFRYAAQELAGGFALDGFVRNLADGTVEVVAEGRPAEVSGLFAAIQRRMAPYIEETRVNDAPPAGIKGFRIRY